jgi:hypothetical protein
LDPESLPDWRLDADRSQLALFIDQLEKPQSQLVEVPNCKGKDQRSLTYLATEQEPNRYHNDLNNRSSLPKRQLETLGDARI